MYYLFKNMYMYFSKLVYKISVRHVSVVFAFLWRTRERAKLAENETVASLSPGPLKATLNGSAIAAVYDRRWFSKD